MGTYYPTGATRQSLIQELTADRKNNSYCVAHCLRGNCLWSVWQPPKGIDANSWIHLDLLVCHGGEWGYKPLSEECHPYYYTCPLSYLKLAPVVACQDWRLGVKRYHAGLKIKRAEKLARKARELGYNRAYRFTIGANENPDESFGL